MKRAEGERIRCDAATLICCAPRRIQFSAFTFILSLTTEHTHLQTVLPPLSPGFRGRGGGGEGAIRVASAIRSEAADLAPRTDVGNAPP